MKCKDCPKFKESQAANFGVCGTGLNWIYTWSYKECRRKD